MFPHRLKFGDFETTLVHRTGVPIGSYVDLQEPSEYPPASLRIEELIACAYKLMLALRDNGRLADLHCCPQCALFFFAIDEGEGRRFAMSATLVAIQSPSDRMSDAQHLRETQAGMALESAARHTGFILGTDRWSVSGRRCLSSPAGGTDDYNGAIFERR